MQQQLQPGRGMKIWERNSSAETKVSEEEEVLEVLMQRFPSIL